LRRELNATYLASSCAQTNIIKNSLSGKMGKLGKILEAVGGSVPVIGGGVQFLGLVLSAVDENLQNQYVERFANIADSAMEMDRLGQGIAQRLVEDCFYREVLDNKRQSLVKQIFSKILKVATTSLDKADKDLMKMGTEVVMKLGSDEVADKLVLYRDRIEEELAMYRGRLAVMFGGKRDDQSPDPQLAQTSDPAAAPPPEPKASPDQVDPIDEATVDDTTRGQTHAKVLVSIIITKVFHEEVKVSGGKESIESVFVEAVIEAVRAHFAPKAGQDGSSSLTL
jgi:hypothetical protein